MFQAELEFRPRLRRRLVKHPKKDKVTEGRLLGRRFAMTRDPGTGAMFAREMFRTQLVANHFGADGTLIESLNLGSGKVTNIGVLALANDYRWAQVSGNPVNVFGAAKFHAWGTGTNAEAKTDFELQTYAEPTGAEHNAVEGTNSLVFQNEGKNQKLKSVATITNSTAGTLAITEWGLHTAQALKPATKTLAASGQTATLFKDSGTALTESTATARGEQNKAAFISESTGVSHTLLGLIVSSTTSTGTVPGWIKAGTEEKGEEPKASSTYRVLPVLWDRRKFEVVNVEVNNKIEFIYELEFVAGG